MSGKGPPLKLGSRVVLQSPLILSPQVCLTFAYHMLGSSMGSLEVYIRRGKHSRKMWSDKGDKGDKWLTAQVELAVNIEYKVRLAFPFCIYHKIFSNLYLDTIQIDAASI